jgi:alpha-ketoglutaric semialdehyde dehydrogenase
MHGLNHVGFKLSGENQKYLHSFSTLNNTYLPGQFRIATNTEIEVSVKKASEAFNIYKRIDPEKRAIFLDEIAHQIINKEDELIERAMKESALSRNRILSERLRTVNQLKLYAKLLREGSWVEASIETGDKARKPFPKPDLRKMLHPIGPVVIFTASNFPLAYSTAGGDTASALAAGNPVIIKAHESHLGTNEIVADAIIAAAKYTGMPDGVFSSLIGNGNTLGQELVKHPSIKAVGFTGSLSGGRALFNLAQNRKYPIPVFAEMGSINPVVLFPDELKTNLKKIVKNYALSITLDVGQFCTNPGLIIGIRGKELEDFIIKLSKRFKKTASETMLSENIWTNYYGNRQKILDQKGVKMLIEGEGDEELKAKPTLAIVDARTFINNPHLSEEVFGPFSMIVICENSEELIQVADCLNGQLTTTIIANQRDIINYRSIIEEFKENAGRLIFNGVPTGVEVCKAMNHGGPYPATTDARFTAVGEDAIKRWVRPIAYQDSPQEFLPEQLKNKNSLNIHRMVNGKLTRKSL